MLITFDKDVFYPPPPPTHLEGRPYMKQVSNVGTEIENCTEFHRFILQITLVDAVTYYVRFPGIEH